MVGSYKERAMLGMSSPHGSWMPGARELAMWEASQRRAEYVLHTTSMRCARAPQQSSLARITLRRADTTPRSRETPMQRHPPACPEQGLDLLASTDKKCGHAARGHLLRFGHEGESRPSRGGGATVAWASAAASEGGECGRRGQREHGLDTASRRRPGGQVRCARSAGPLRMPSLSAHRRGGIAQCSV